MDEDLRQKIALFRYSLIAPVITNTYTQSSVKEYFQEICAKQYDTPAGKKEFAPSTVKDWLRLYRKHGINGLYPKLRKDKGNFRKLSDEAKEFILSCKAEFPSRSAKSIYFELIARGYFSLGEISLSTVQRFLSKNPLPLEHKSSERRAFEFEFPNDCWQSDISSGPYLTIDGKKHKTYIIAFLDDASRLVVSCRAFFEDNFVSLLSVFKDAVSKRGIPKKIFVDNGKVYKSEQMEFICASLGTILCFARPYSPQSKGKIERWFKTLQEQWLSSIDYSKFSSLEELNESLQEYVEGVYNVSYHSSIKQKPIEKYMKHIEKIKFISSKQEIDYMFLYRITRKVRNDCTIQILNNSFEVPFKYVGERINVRYDPSSLDKAYIFSDDNRILDTIYPVNKIDNSKVKRQKNIKPIDFSSFSANPKEV
ncbi:Integrase core domain protein [Caloramator mitchellensis]|uniref:Integrase core domain protein n=1 Tax=Caloramator mitchellensis TaxID=908809 RepID=A0A0R3JQQ5_CALMK|nr:DDE-type integrase/transposase/recombinase [Caloramator mitchellensis]KRQ85777.1 Integrase core domain protein [Caloramator mitchellensis]